VVAALLLGGVLGGLLYFGTVAAAPPPTFFEARGEANRSMSLLLGGGWRLVSALGLDQRSGTAVNLTSVTNASGSDCAPAAIPGYTLPTSLSVPSYSGSFAAGRAPLWLFLYRQSATGPFVFAEVANGVAQPLSGVTGSACLTDLESLSPLSNSTVDSPGIAAAAWNSPGDAGEFVAGDAAIDTLAMLATGSFKDHGYTFAGWGLEYAPCGVLSSGTGTGQASYVVGFSPTGGFYAAVSTTTDCPG
jgi:hypothetical protein